MTIEECRRWPKPQTEARAVFLRKDVDNAGDPMAYRILKVTSIFYRIWASTRMRDLENWIRQWADPAIFAGIPGMGAEDGLVPHPA